MKISVHKENNSNIAYLDGNEIIIHEVQDGVDLVGNLYFESIHKVILFEYQITPDFFELRSGIAGEILQKFSTYNIKLAIVGDFDKYQSKSLNDFIFESNKRKHILFVSTFEEGIEMLSINGI